MKVGISEFELYLMSKMSARHLVDTALQRQGVSREIMDNAAAEVPRQLDLRDGCSHDVYHQLLGPTLVAKYSERIPLVESLHESTAYFYRLPTWPDTLLQINSSRLGLGNLFRAGS